jgi:protein N-terminal asparagine amidohydrolase
LDGSGTDEAVCTMVQRVQELALGYPEGRIELQLIGGFSDARHYSEELFYNVMTSFHKHPVEIDLTLACVGELNTTIRGGIHWPIIYGIGVNTKTGEIFPATFPDKGPDQALRCSRYLTGVSQVLDIYDCSLGLLRIGPFNYEPLRGVDLWLEQSDDFILQHLSTSPDVEPPHFVMQVRATLKYIQDNQFPAVTVFRDNRPHYFRRDEHSGIWTPVRY